VSMKVALTQLGGQKLKSSCEDINKAGSSRDQDGAQSEHAQSGDSELHILRQ
jgi:hypothetical protein